MVSDDKSYQFVHHSEDCRIRMEKAMREAEDFRDKVMKAESRRSARMSELAEKIKRKKEPFENSHQQSGKKRRVFGKGCERDQEDGRHGFA